MVWIKFDKKIKTQKYTIELLLFLKTFAQTKPSRDNGF